MLALSLIICKEGRESGKVECHTYFRKESYTCGVGVLKGGVLLLSQKRICKCPNQVIKQEE